MEHQRGKEDISVIRWKPISTPPDNCSYILIKCLDEFGRVVCEPAAYEDNEFIYIYDRATWGEIRKEVILGWSYYPFDDRNQ